ncbi:MAG TPA: hypothetical protein VGM90_34420 [Kofleriaceae bacterium]|jgi:hypothetical protein
MLSVAACKKGDKPAPSPALSGAPAGSASATTTPAAPDPSTGFCRYEITGSVTGKGESPGTMSSLGADYYYDQPIDPAAKPSVLFTVVCKGPVQINFAPGPGLGYADVPFEKAGEWKIGMARRARSSSRASM